jgi:4-hydroxy-L-threonine phosphate dehydrogenase PdxA
MNTQKDQNKIRVGITHGDYNGISYEIIIKTLKDPRILELCTPVVYGTSKLASYHRKAIEVSDFSFNIIRSAQQANLKKANLVNLEDEELPVELGNSTPEAALVL